MPSMQQVLTLTDDELTAVTEGAELLQALVDRLKDVPTPGGPTKQRIGALPCGASFRTARYSTIRRLIFSRP